MIHLTSQMAEDELKVVISKTFSEFVSGACQTPTHSVPFSLCRDTRKDSGERGQIQRNGIINF